MRIAISADDKNDLDSLISPHFGRCLCFVLVDVEGQEVKAVTAVDNPYYGNHVPGQVPAFIQSQGADVMLTGGMGHRAVSFFEQYGIQPVTGASGTVRQALQSYLGGELYGVEPCAESHEHHLAANERTSKTIQDRGENLLMKIAITTETANLDSRFHPRFGRAANFVIVDSDTEEWEAYPNPAVNASGGAGIQAAQFIAGHGVQVVISGDFGPKAYNALAAGGVQMYLAAANEAATARELLARYRQGQLNQVSAPTNPGHHAPPARGQGGG